MGTYPPSLDRLIKALSRLPGIGPKMAARLAVFIIRSPKGLAVDLGQAILEVSESINYCPECFNLTDKPLCPICNDDRRNNSQICVVEGPVELAAIERSGVFNGRYHVLGGLLDPLDKIGPSKLRINELKTRVKRNKINEVIIALSSTVKGEATAAFIKEFMSETNTKISRLAFGLPMGADIDYADPETLKASLIKRSDL